MSKRFRVIRQDRSRYWYADFFSWDAAEGAWRRRFVSTKKTDEGEAREVASAMAAAAQKVAGAPAESWTRERAEELVNDLLKAAGVRASASSCSWHEFVKQWLTERERKAAVNALAERTVVLYRRRLGKFTDWLGARGAAPLDALTGFDLQGFYDSLREGGLGAGAAGDVITTLREVFERARNEGVISRNPAALVSMDQDKGRLKREAFTPEEVKRLVQATRVWVSSMAAEWETMIYLGICTGQRIEDCARMGFSHLQKRDGMEVIVFKPAKTARLGTVVEIPVVEPLKSHLRKLRRGGQGQLLFCPVLAQKVHLSNFFADLMALAKIEMRYVVNPVTGRKLGSKSFHSFRHTLPSWLKAAGVDEETRMRIVGHASKRIHQGYTHIELSAVAKALSSALAGLAG